MAFRVDLRPKQGKSGVTSFAAYLLGGGEFRLWARCLQAGRRQGPAETC